MREDSGKETIHVLTQSWSRKNQARMDYGTTLWPRRRCDESGSGSGSWCKLAMAVRQAVTPKRRYK